MHKGSCLCGGLRYTLAHEPMNIELCHCSICRKAHAAPFTAGASVDAAAFRITQGHELAKYFESSPGKRRYFCSNCGTHVYALRPAKPDVIRLRVATLDTPIASRPIAHIYSGSKAEWYTIEDTILQKEDA